MSAELKSYIETQLNSGYSKDAIITALQKAGWDDESISTSFPRVPTEQVKTAAVEAAAPNKIKLFDIIPKSMTALSRVAPKLLGLTAINIGLFFALTFILALLLGLLMFIIIGTAFSSFASTGISTSIGAGSLISYIIFLFVIYIVSILALTAVVSIAISNTSALLFDSLGANVKGFGHYLGAGFKNMGRVYGTLLVVAFMTFLPILISFTYAIIGVSQLINGSGVLSRLFLLFILVLSYILSTFIGLYYSAMPLIALFSPGQNLKERFKINTGLMTNGGLWFFAKAFLILYLPLTILLTFITSKVSATSTLLSLIVNLFIWIVILYGYTGIVTTYLRERLSING